MRKWLLMLLALALVLLPACAAHAEGREIKLETRVMKWGQMPQRFVITNQALPEGVTASDFAITGQGGGLGKPVAAPVQLRGGGRGGH